MSDDGDLPDEQPDDDLPSEQPTVDAGDRRSVRRQRDKITIDRENAENFWRTVFSTPVGRQEMWRLLQSAHVFEERFACGPNGFPQPEATWFHAGEQAFGMRLYQSWMLIDRAAVFLMHDENDSRFSRPEPHKSKREK